MKRAFVALSGGVDSAVAAARLLDEGYAVEAVSIALWDAPRADDRICSNHEDAGRVADWLGLPHTRLDARDEFRQSVVRPFVKGYAAGQTPNPCVACNSRFKLGQLYDWARSHGADVVATGHYARITPTADGPALRRAADPGRDQSYFLFELAREQLPHLAFPVGDLTKDEVRRRAVDIGLPVANRPDSQDLCFGAPGKFARAEGEGGRAGNIVDGEGQVLGKHEGVENFTVGQRRGLGVSAGERLYVQALDAPHAEVRVGVRPPEAAGLVAVDWHWLGEPPAAGEELLVQLRSRSRPVPARVLVSEDGTATVRFVGCRATVAPGQAAVVYRGDVVVGGGWIRRPVGPA